MDEHDANSASFLQALATASAPDYLGSIAVVNEILCTLADEVTKRRLTMDPETLKMANDLECHRLAAIFLGHDTKNYTPMIHWNSEGQIDRYVATVVTWISPTPEPVMEYLFAQFIEDFYRLGDYANEPGVLECNWNWQGRATVETYVHFLLRIPYPPE